MPNSNHIGQYLARTIGELTFLAILEAAAISLALHGQVPGIVYAQCNCHDASNVRDLQPAPWSDRNQWRSLAQYFDKDHCRREDRHRENRLPRPFAVDVASEESGRRKTDQDRGSEEQPGDEFRCAESFYPP